MSVGFGGAVKLTGESDYRKALREISQDLKELSAETKLVTAEYGSNDKSLTALTAKQNALNKQYEAQAQKVKILSDQYAKMSAEQDKNKEKHSALLSQYNEEAAKLEKIAQESGKTSQEYQDQAQKVSDLSTEVNKSSKALDQNEASLSKMRIELTNSTADMKKTENEVKDLGKQMDNTGKDSTELGSDVKKAGKEADSAAKGGFTVLKGVLANLGADAIKAIPKALVSGITSLGKAFGNAAVSVSEAGDSIAKGAANANLSIKGYQELSYVLDRSGASIEGVKNAMLKLETAASSNNKAFKELGISSEELASMTPEETFNRTITALQGITDESKRSQLAAKLLGKGFGTDLGSVLNMTAEETDALKQKAHDLGLVMSDESVKNSETFGDSLDDLKDSLTGIKNNIVSQFLPSLTQVTDGLTAIFTGNNTEEGLKKVSDGVSSISSIILSKAPDILSAASSIFNSLLTAAASEMPKIAQTIGGLIQEGLPVLTEFLKAGLPVLISGIEETFSALMSSLPVLLPALFDAVSVLITDFCNWISQEGNVKSLLNSLLDLTLKLTEQIMSLLPIIIPAVFSLIGEIADFLTDPKNIAKLTESLLYTVGALAVALVKSLPQFLKILGNLGSNIIELFVGIGKSLGSTIGGALDSARKTVSGWIDKVKSLLSSLKDKLVTGFITVKDNIVNFVGNALSALGELPKKMIDIGKNAIEGIIKGIKNTIGKAVSTIKDAGKSLLNGIKGALGIHSPSTLFRDIVGKNIALGIGEGFSQEMKNVSREMQDEIPTLEAGAVNYGSGSTGGSILDFNTLVNAFKTALGDMTVELDDREVGKFVKKTVSTAIYYS